MRRTRAIACLIAAVAIAFPALARAQDTTAVPGVRLGLNYQAGTKPGVIVLPVQDDYGDDSLRTIVQRDLDYSDRLTVIALDSRTLKGLTPALGGKINFPLVGKFGAALLIRMTPTSTGLHVAAYDVAKGELLQSDQFLFGCTRRRLKKSTVIVVTSGPMPCGRSGNNLISNSFLSSVSRSRRRYA